MIGNPKHQTIQCEDFLCIGVQLHSIFKLLTFKLKNYVL
jgi:hypothetical protein